MNEAQLQEVKSQWDKNTGDGFSWYQGVTSDVIALLDVLTASPSAVVEMPVFLTRVRKERLKIKVSKADSAAAFYLLMQKGEIKCLPDDVYEINKDLIDHLTNNAISFEVI